jgi:hypothetical protein
MVRIIGRAGVSRNAREVMAAAGPNLFTKLLHVPRLM